MTMFGTAMKELGELDTLARQHSPIHGIDPRAKLATAVLFLIAVVSSNRYEIIDLVPFAAFPILLACLGRVPFSFLARKLAYTLPFVLLFGAFNPVFDTAPREIAEGITLSGGWISYLSIIVKFLLTVAAALSLVAVTGMYPLCSAAEKLGMPNIFVTQLALFYRYLFVLTAEAGRMHRAALLRSPGKSKLPLSLFGSLAGHLFLRTADRAQRIYLAMRCRGFSGEFHLMCPMRFQLRDGLFFFGWTAYFAAMRFFHLPDIIGNAVLRIRL